MKNDAFKITDKSGDRKYFAMIPYYVVNHSSAYEQSLYLVMKRIASEEGTCWASPQTIAKIMDVAANTVRKYRKKLEQRGWIKKIGTRQIGKTNQSTYEYEIVDLWKLNMDFYAKKKKGSSDESFQQEEESSQLALEKDAAVGNKEEGITEETMKKIYIRYSEKINKNSRLTEEAKRKIKTRLRIFNEGELLQAIDNFSGDKWWMEHNAHRGIAWFFHSDDRIDQFLNLPQPKRSGSGKYDHLITKA